MLCIYFLYVVGEHFNYEWALISKPGGEDNAGTMNNKNGATVELSNLNEGLYTFNVSVTAQDGFGSTLVNVTVLPRKYLKHLLESGFYSMLNDNFFIQIYFLSVSVFKPKDLTNHQLLL